MIEIIKFTLLSARISESLGERISIQKMSFFSKSVREVPFGGSDPSVFARIVPESVE